MPEGKKYDVSKVRYELLPPELLESTAKVLTYGANKYTINYETEWDRLLDVSNVLEIKLNIAEECVVHVTKETSEKLVLNTPKDKGKIVGIGRNEIQTELRRTPNVGKLIQNVVQETKELNGLDIYENSDYQKNLILNSVQEVVKSADQNPIFILAIVIQRDNSEVFSAQSVTMDSVFWETTWKDLKELFNISRPLNQTGNRNWELGMNWSRVFGACMRHLWAWWNPFTSSVDEETGMSHLWHAGCCIAFLITYEQRSIGEDDRPTK